MDWHEAREQAVLRWEGLREAAGAMEETELLAELNAVFSLCEVADADLQAHGGGPNHCRYCAFYQQFGGCKAISLEMSERCVERDWEGLQALIDQFLRELRLLKLPPETAALGAEAPAA